MLLRLQERDDLIGIIGLTSNQFQTERRQERLIGAAGASFGAFGKATVIGSQRTQQLNQVVNPLSLTVLNHLCTACHFADGGTEDQ